MPGEREVEVFDVPGAFELPLAASYAARSGRFAGVACLGAVIRGETDHYDFVCAETARGVMRVQLDTGVPCAFGVLTCETMEQALARAGGGKRDQGRHAAEAVHAHGRAAARSEPERAEHGPRGSSSDHLDCARRWPRYVTAAGRPAFGQSRSHSMVATKRRLIRTCRRSGSSWARRPGACTCARAA